MTEGVNASEVPLTIHSTNPDQESRLGLLSGIPLRRLKLQHNTLRAKQEILAKFMHLRAVNTGALGPKMQPKARSLGCGAYSIRMAPSDRKVPALPKQNSYNTDAVLQSESKQQIQAGKTRAFRISLTSSQSIQQKKKCPCSDCEECTKDFTAFLKIYVEDDSIPTITAKSWCLWRKEKGRFNYVYGKRPYKQREIASLTKIMTALVVQEKLQRWGFNPSHITIEIPQSCINMKGTSANLRPGELLTVHDLMHGLMLPSGNDAAIVLAQAFGLMMWLESKRRLKVFEVSNPESFKHFSTKTYGHLFVNAMNEKAKDMGITNTVFYNPHGNDAFDAGRNASNALEIGRICFTLMEDNYLMNLVNTREYGTWQNTNKLLWEGFQGIKTGVNEASGPCLAAVYKDVVIVILNSKTMEDRWIEVKRLVRWVSSRRSSLA